MRNWKRDARVIYLRYRKSPGNIRCKSTIVDLCEMKRTRYIGNNLQFIDIGESIRESLSPTVRDRESANCFEQWTKCLVRDIHTHTYTYIRIPGVPRVNARVLMQIHGRYLADRDSSYVGRVTRNCRTYIHRIRARTWRIAYPRYIVHTYDVTRPAYGGEYCRR